MLFLLSPDKVKDQLLQSADVSLKKRLSEQTGDICYKSGEQHND
jgi:hypothetical protein